MVKCDTDFDRAVKIANEKKILASNARLAIELCQSNFSFLTTSEGFNQFSGGRVRIVDRPFLRLIQTMPPERASDNIFTLLEKKF